MIELDGISKEFPRPGAEPVRALRDATLRIERGEFVAIVGTSGSGKSTLLTILGALDRPSGGRYVFDGEDVAQMDPAEQARFRNRRIGFVFQSFHLLERTTALENVELPLIYSDRENIDGLGAKALAAVGLADRMAHSPGELSGGQQQRVAIARALVNEPQLLLADEPTGNLDAASAREIMRIFRDLHQQGRTIVLVTHDPLIAAAADRIVRIDDGRIVQDERASVNTSTDATLRGGAR
ncbi:MAG: ABC transporter ATP-binding protein [Gemmatimonadaceae bacterium]